MRTSGCDIFFLIGEKKCLILDSFLGGSGRSSGVGGGLINCGFMLFVAVMTSGAAAIGGGGGGATTLNY